MTRNDEPGTGNGRSAPPLRTWRPMILWSVAILLALGAVWFVADFCFSLHMTSESLLITNDEAKRLAINKGLDHSEAPPEMVRAWCETAIERLGGADRAAKRIGFYLRWPENRWPYRCPDQTSNGLYLLGKCGDTGYREPIRLLSHKSAKLRWHAAWTVRGMKQPLSEEDWVAVDAVLKTPYWKLPD